MGLDIEFVRAQFPAFSEPGLSGQAFFENAGGSYACGQVIDRLTRFYTERKVQPYGPYEASRLGGEELDLARSGLAGIMGVAPDEVSFGPSTTQNTYVLAQAFADWMAEGDAIIVTNQDHEANSGPWRRLEARGIEIREWQMSPESGTLAPEDLANLLDDKVRLVCFPHCSNIVAQINPVAQIAAMVHAAGAFVCVDGVSYAPHGIPDVAALGADIYLFSAYKTFGPHQGIMAIRRHLGEKLPNQGHVFNAGSLEKRFTPAGPDHAQVAASAGIVDYITALADHHGVTGDLRHRASAVKTLIRAQETRQLTRVLDGLKGRNAVRVLGPQTAEARAPTLALNIDDPATAATALAARGIMCAAGDFYAGRALSALGVAPDPGALRLSFLHYTSDAEIDQLLNALDDIL